MSVPEMWIETTVRSVIEDIQPGFSQKPGEEDAGTTAQIRTHNITPDGKISLNGIKHITASQREIARYSLVVGDVVFNNTNSEEWVGKTAVFNLEGEYVFSNHMTRLRVRRDLVLPEYLAGYLQMMWSIGYTKTRAKRWVSQAGIESDTLASFKILLPALTEQKRIIEVMQQLEATPDLKLRRQQLDSMVKSALDRLVLSSPLSEWEQLGALVETRYGTSVSADSTAETGVAVLRIPNVMGGEVDIEDLKFVSLSPSEIGRLALTVEDVLIVRSNGNPEYVGRSAPITEDVAKSAMVYASYLIRLRADSARLLPEYLSAFLNSPYGRAAMRNAIRTTAGQSNLSAENLSKVKLPIPTLADQERFRSLWLQIRELRRLVAKSESIAIDLHDALSIHALSGELTLSWRKNHSAEVSEAAHTRDTLLRERGTKIASSGTTKASPTEKASVELRPTRHWLLTELSEFQRQVLTAFSEYCQKSGQPLMVEDPEIFSRFFDDSTVVDQLQSFGHSQGNRIRRTLSQLAALGLIAKITLPKQDLESGERDYIKAFRPLREEEFTRMADIQTLRRALTSNLDQQSYHFEVHLDYETSEHAGAGGMFQVVSVEDEEGKDFAYLIDHGRHYASLDDLRNEIAGALNVTPGQIELEAV